MTTVTNADFNNFFAWLQQLGHSTGETWQEVLDQNDDGVITNKEFQDFVHERCDLSKSQGIDIIDQFNNNDTCSRIEIYNSSNLSAITSSCNNSKKVK